MLKEKRERLVRVGLKRKAKSIFDEIEIVSASMIREGWAMQESFFEENFSVVRLIFERDVDERPY